MNELIVCLWETGRQAILPVTPMFVWNGGISE